MSMQLYSAINFLDLAIIAQSKKRNDNACTHMTPSVKDVHARVSSDQTVKQSYKMICKGIMCYDATVV